MVLTINIKNVFNKTEGFVSFAIHTQIFWIVTKAMRSRFFLFGFARFVLETKTIGSVFLVRSKNFNLWFGFNSVLSITYIIGSVFFRFGQNTDTIGLHGLNHHSVVLRGCGE